MGCDEVAVQHLQHADVVSIHAPAWGATGERRGHHSGGGGFNPRTRVGCDIRATASLPTPRSFNPRTRVGCDLTSLYYQLGSPPFQSTHPRGVRQEQPETAVPSARFVQGFNPRTRVGCDASRLIVSISNFWFQSTHPRGVRRREGGACGRLGAGFNPRTRVGCDPASGASVKSRLPVSIHAPAWGATWCAPGIWCVQCVSIHAPAWGATLIYLASAVGAVRFQSTHPRGVRRSTAPCN